MISLELSKEFKGEEVTVAWIKLYANTGATGYGVVVRNAVPISAICISLTFVNPVEKLFDFVELFVRDSFRRQSSQYQLLG